VRSWSTLFGPSPERKANVNTSDEPKRDTSDVGRTLTDSVGLGYRVIDEYLRQGQQAARTLNPGATGSLPEDAAQMSQRLMQYGWDFAGLWFELWSKMSPGGLGASSPFPPPPGASVGARPATAAPPANAPRTANATVAPTGTPSGGRERVIVTISSQRPTTAALEIRPGAGANLVVHSLRAEGHEAQPIRDITLERHEDGSVMLRVVVGAEQPEGIYNAMILDSVSNLPQGTLSVVIGGSGTPPQA
jgi:hypothetical protein